MSNNTSSTNSNQVYEILATIYSEFDVNGNPILQSGTTYLLDCDYSQMITLDLSINEIQDISQRNSTYSKTITLPDTGNNRKIFGYISQLNYDARLFNPNKRVFCQILVDTIVIYTGYLQLKNPKQNYLTGDCSYECVFFSSITNFFKQMGEYYLTDLIGNTASGGFTFSTGANGLQTGSGLNRYNHLWTCENVIYSWTQSQTFGYYYPLIDYGYLYLTQSGPQQITTGMTMYNIGGYTANSITNGPTGSAILSQMYPSVYVKTILDEIFAEAGYQYDSVFLNSTFFKSLVIPFSNQNLLMPYQSIPLQSQIDLYNIENPSLITQNNVVSVNDIFSFSADGGTYYIYTLDLTYETPTINFAVNMPYDIGTTNYFKTMDVSAGFYQNTSTYSVYYKPLINLEIVGTFSAPYTYQSGGTTSYGNMINYYFNDDPLYEPDVYFAVLPNGATQAAVITRYSLIDMTNSYYNAYYYDSNGYSDGSTWFLQFTGQTYPNNYPTTNPLSDNGYYLLQPNDIAFVFLGLETRSGDVYELSSGMPVFTIAGSIQNNISNQVPIGGPINIPANLPANIKQKDFITNLYKLFNLYVEPNKLYPNILNIEPRDYYYTHDINTNGIVVMDWTSKVDLTQDIEIDILSNTQNKTLTYTYKTGEADYPNTYYNSITNRTYGDAILNINNDFATDNKVIDNIFAPSVLYNVAGANNFPITNFCNQLDPTLNYPTGPSNISMRILQKSLNTATGSWVNMGVNPIYGTPYSIYGPSDSYSLFGVVNLDYGDTWAFGTYSATHSSGYTYSTLNQIYTFYPYAGNYDDPYNPTIDLNFNQALFPFYYPNISNVPDNLFYTFYQNQFNEMNDINSRIMTCEMYLTPYDISQFYFNHMPYIELGGNGRYWRVNKISNYDISGRSTCSVELISVLNNQVNSFLTTLVPVAGVPVITTSTTTTTTTLLYYSYTINASGDDYSSAFLACNDGVGDGITVYCLVPNLTTGQVVYNALHNPYSGNLDGLFYSITDNNGTKWAAVINTEGLISDASECSSITTSTTTTTTTSSPTTTTTTSSTTTTTTKPPVYSYQVYNQGFGFVSAEASCSGYTSTNETLYSISATLTNGMFLYTNEGLTSIFNGSSLWWPIVISGVVYAVQINNDGEVLSFSNCSSLTTTTTTLAPTTSTTTSTTTLAPTTSTTTTTTTAAPTYYSYTINASGDDYSSAFLACNDGVGDGITVYCLVPNLTIGQVVYNALHNPYSGNLDGLFYSITDNNGTKWAAVINTEGLISDASECS